MTYLYEFGISGRHGVALTFCVPGFELVTCAPSTVLTGKVRGPGGLRHLLDVLEENGLETVDVRLTAVDDEGPITVTARYHPNDDPER